MQLTGVRRQDRRIGRIFDRHLVGGCPGGGESLPHLIRWSEQYGGQHPFPEQLGGRGASARVRSFGKDDPAREPARTFPQLASEACAWSAHEGRVVSLPGVTPKSFSRIRASTPSETKGETSPPRDATSRTSEADRKE